MVHHLHLSRLNLPGLPEGLMERIQLIRAVGVLGGSFCRSLDCDGFMVSTHEPHALADSWGVRKTAPAKSDDVDILGGNLMVKGSKYPHLPLIRKSCTEPHKAWELIEVAKVEI